MIPADCFVPCTPTILPIINFLAAFFYFIHCFFGFFPHQWCWLIIIISGFRLVASDNGVVIAASYWGKFKTTFQMLMIIFTIFNIYLENDVLDVISNILVYVALALTVISLIDYMLKNKDVLKDQK